MTHADRDDSAPAGRWGRAVERAEIGGHSALIYSNRPRALAELVLDARRWGDRTFVVEGERRLTFAQHEAAVARVARHLRNAGIGAGDRVLIVAYNRLEWLIAFWALQCIGAVALLGNAWWSDEELAAALELSEPSALLTDRTIGVRHHWGQAPVGAEASMRVLRIEDLRAIVDASETIELEVASVDEDALAMIMFSSGTTGAAKGVMMTHRSVIANIQNLLVLTGRMPHELPADAPGTVSLLTMPLFHLAGIQISFTTMLSGGTLVFAEGRFDPLAILRVIEREKIRAWGSVPTMVSRVIDEPRFGEFDTSSIKSIPMGGAAVSPELRAKIAAAFPATKKRGVGSLYGLTEAGGVLAAGSADDLAGRPGCVGKLLPVVEVRIDKPDANGVGEILARTPTITSGYWRDDTPITDADGWLKTGDLGRLDDERRLYLVGRSKDIVIRGGENIACAHVERCLLQHPAVREAAVVALPHADLGEEVAAAVVLKDGMSATPAELTAHAAAHLGRFEVPSRWWIREEPLPTNASGKIAKRDVVAQWPAG